MDLSFYCTLLFVRASTVSIQVKQSHTFILKIYYNVKEYKIGYWAVRLLSQLPKGHCQQQVVYNQCYGSGMFFRIPDQTFFHPGSRIRIFSIRESILTPKKLFLISRKYDPGCSFRIPDPDPQNCLQHR
jgi:hypothetical protein